MDDKTIETKKLTIKTQKKTDTKILTLLPISLHYDDCCCVYIFFKYKRFRRKLTYTTPFHHNIGIAVLFLRLWLFFCKKFRANVPNKSCKYRKLSALHENTKKTWHFLLRDFYAIFLMFFNFIWNYYPFRVYAGKKV